MRWKHDAIANARNRKSKRLYRRNEGKHNIQYPKYECKEIWSWILGSDGAISKDPKQYREKNVHLLARTHTQYKFSPGLRQIEIFIRDIIDIKFTYQTILCR